jgi:hypothetical protein
MKSPSCCQVNVKQQPELLDEFLPVRVHGIQTTRVPMNEIGEIAGVLAQVDHGTELLQREAGWRSSDFDHLSVVAGKRNLVGDVLGNFASRALGRIVSN